MNIFPPKAPKSQKVAEGEPTIIAKTERGRFGFMAGEIEIPEDFNEMGAAEIEEMFYRNQNPK